MNKVFLFPVTVYRHTKQTLTFYFVHLAHSQLVQAARKIIGLLNIFM